MCQRLDFQNYTIQDMEPIQVGALIRYFMLSEELGSNDDIHTGIISKIHPDTRKFNDLYYVDVKKTTRRNPAQFQQKLNQLLLGSELIQIQKIRGNTIYAPIARIDIMENGHTVTYDSKSADMSIIEVCKISGGFRSRRFRRSGI